MTAMTAVTAMTQRLRLIPTRRSQREAVAWLIPGDDPATWLAALRSAGAPLKDLRLCIVPHSASDRRPRGVLILPSAGKPLQQPDARCEPYGLEADRLYLPTHARLCPAIDTAECRELILTRPSLFHPVVGLVAFEPADILRPLDLLIAPPPTGETWDRARPGVMLSPRLYCVMPPTVSTLREIEDDLRGDIGTKPLDEAPPQDGEPRDSMVKNAALGAARGFFSAIRAIARAASGLAGSRSRPPSTRKSGTHRSGASVGGPGFFERINAWAGKQLQRIGSASEAKRTREIERLLKMLSHSPMEALKYAIPLNGGDNGRGIAPPSDRLGTRNIEFNLGRLGGGEPVDPWDIPWEAQERLSRRYREMAMQEARSGRHRRAAYIFANLLADLHAAAGVLEQGGYFREAAVIWRDRLKAPQLAAGCLERGGLLIEAAALYSEMACWLDAARLYRRLEREDEARECVLKEVAALKEKHDYLTAANLLETDLKDIDAAVAMLEQGRLRAGQRMACFEELLLILGRHGRHRAANEALALVSKQLISASDACGLCELLARVRAAYPDRDVADAMTEVAYRLASDHLRGSTADQAQRLTQAIAALAPQDRLLARDGQRYSKQQRSTHCEKAAPKVHRHDQVVVNIGESQLPSASAAGFVAYGGASVGRLFYACVRDAESEGVIRGDAAGDFYIMSWATRGGSGGDDHDDSISIHLGHTEADDVLLHRPAGRVPAQMFPATDRYPGVRVHMPQWLPVDAWSVCTAMYGQVWAVTRQGDGCLLNGWSREGTLIESLDVDIAEVFGESDVKCDHDDLRLSLHVRPRRTLLAFANRLHYPGHRKRPYTPFGQAIRGIIGVAPFARSRVALLHPMGATVLWMSDTDDESTCIASDLIDPVGAFTFQSGLLILASGGECRVFGTSKAQIEPIQTIRWHERTRQKPVAVLPLEPNDNFALLFASGEIVRYHVTPPHGGRR